MTNPLPDDAVRTPMTRHRASQHAIPRRELDGVLWDRRFQGVHSWRERSAADPMVRIEDAATLLPVGGAIGGWAAAHLLGAQDLDGRLGAGVTFVPVTLCLQPDVQVRPRAGIIHLRSEFADDEVEYVSGIPVLNATRTCFDLVRRAPDLAEAVVGIDAMLRAGLVSLERVKSYLATRPRWRGTPQGRRAVDLASERTRSCQESRFRVLWTIEARLPRPSVNTRLYSSSSGALLGEVDLLDATAALAGEYDGADHRELRRHAADNVREEALESHGLVVVRATALDLTLHRRRTIFRLRQAHQRGLNRDRALDRWTTAPRQ